MLLLDEPLGALDLKLREEMQSELKTLQQRLGITFVFVTHDQGEALSMADRVAVFNQGRIEQLDTPRELYTRPQTAFVADFVGSANVVQRELAAATDGRAQPFAIRPELIDVLPRRAPPPAGQTSARASAGRAVSRRRAAAGRCSVDDATMLIVDRRRKPRQRRRCQRRARACGSPGARQRRAAQGMTVERAATRAAFRCTAARRSTVALLLAPPLLWLGIVYLGSLFTLLLQSFYAIDEFTARVVPKSRSRPTGSSHAAGATSTSCVRTLLMAVAVTIACAVVAFPIANYMARYAGPRMKAFFYVGVMLPMWTSYLVKVYAWRLILAKQGIAQLGARQPSDSTGALDAAARHAGRRRAVAGLVVPRHVHRVRLHVAAVHDPAARGRARAGARLAAAGIGRPRRAPRQTFRNVVVPLALPGLAAGSVFTFSLTLGDYIIPSVVGAPGYFIGMMVYQQQGTAGNMPLAAAFSVVPIVLIGLYLTLARRARSVRCALSADVRLASRRSLHEARGRTPGSRSCTCRCCVIVLYAFTTEDRTYQFPPPGFTLHWFDAAFARDDIWAAMRLSLAVACVRHAARDHARHARCVRARATRSSAARNRSRCCSCCRSRCPAS